jgi:hypothetical protein
MLQSSLLDVGKQAIFSELLCLDPGENEHEKLYSKPPEINAYIIDFIVLLPW